MRKGQNFKTQGTIMDDKAEKLLNEAKRLLDIEPDIEPKVKTRTRDPVRMIGHIMLKAYPAINAKVEETNEWIGEIECPACGKKLHYSKAKCNGHIHGQCETEGCLSWMQ